MAFRSESGQPPVVVTIRGETGDKLGGCLMSVVWEPGGLLLDAREP